LQIHSLNQLVVPFDGSLAAEITLPYVVELANASNAHIHLVKVSESTSASFEFKSIAYLEKIANRLEGQFSNLPSGITLQALTGNPASEILKYADSADVDLVVISSRGANDDPRWSLGSVADKILRATEKPVLLIKKPVVSGGRRRKKLIKRILLPLDGSSAGESAMPLATEMAFSLKARTMLLRVVAQPMLRHGLADDFFDEMPIELIEQAGKIEETRKRAVKKYLHSVELKIKERKISSSSIVVVGQPAEQILDFADANNIDLIALSSHGRSGRSRWAFGCIADKLLHAGDKPVLLVKAT
jgi:nucleotide-binding universal stress UspA family protein